MSTIANKRALAASVNALIKTNAPQAAHVDAVCEALVALVCDLTGMEYELILKVKDAPEETMETAA